MTHYRDSLELALATVEALAPLIHRISRRDRHLGDQLRRSSQSVALNIAEADGHRGGNRRLRLETALGSARETRTALHIALAWGYIGADEHRAVDADLDRVTAMTWRRLKATG